MTQETDDAMPCIDLMNFEDPQFEEGKYVLTSPRSLEACSRLGVKPVDLLYKPLAEFQEELLPQDVPLRTIYNIYDEHEHNRERKLALCREERIRIMEGEKGTTSGKPTVTKSKKTPSAVPKTQTRRSKLASKRSQSAENLGSGSLQRQRTAWATSVGHDRITNDEINQRVKDLHNESMKLRSELLSRKEARATSKRSNKKTRPATARTSTRKKTNISRSYSASDLSLAGTSMLSRSGTADARPITSSRLKKVLKNEAKNAPITPTDEKILELMYMKGEGEKMEARERQLREIQWERQKQEAEAIRLAGEMRRRRMLAEENRIQKLKKCEAELQHKAEEQRLQEKQEQLLNETSRRWRTRYLTVQKTQALKSIEKVEKEQLKKRIQENNVRALEAEEEEMKELVRQKQGRQILTAAQKKEAKLLEESMRVMMNNRSERRNFEDRWNSLLKDTQESIDLLLESMNAKDQKHKSKYEQLQQRRENEITLNRLDREKRALQAKLSQQQHENEMEEWRDNIMSSREIAERHATETLAETIERKARKAHEERVRKEKEQQKNIKKIHQEISQWKKSQESLIQLKDKKSDLIQQEKELTIQQSRHVAASGQKLRDSLRNKLGGETFDKMAMKAEMYNKFEMGNTFFSAEKNTSHVKLH